MVGIHGEERAEESDKAKYIGGWLAEEAADGRLKEAARMEDKCKSAVMLFTLIVLYINIFGNN